MVVLYTTHCPKCQVLEKKLQKAQIEYSTCDNVDFMKSQGWNEAPILKVYDKIMDFRKAIEWINNQG